MGHKHEETQVTHSKETESNQPGGKPQEPPQQGGLTDPSVPVHEVKPAPPGSIPVGQEGPVSVRFLTLEGGMVQLYGTLEGTGGGKVDMGIHPELTVS